MITMMEGTCAGCGQMQTVQANSESAADIVATKKCGCEDSKPIKRKWQLQDNINRIAGETCEAMGFEAFDEDARKMLVIIAQWVSAETCPVNKVTLGGIDDTTITIARKANEKTTITRKKTTEIETETED